MTAAHLTAIGESDRLAGLTFVVTVLDQSRAGLASAVVDRRTADAAAAVSARKGYLDGRTLAEVFAWLRPGDLIWNYWVNNYLLGKSPPAFDILFWNADVTRMPARLHRDFLELAVENALTKPGQAQLLAVRSTSARSKPMPTRSLVSPITSATGSPAIALFTC
jgi:polyhydroxyalkanoate synthase